MEVTVRKASLEDFQDMLVLFAQLWEGKELHPDELIKVIQRGLDSETDTLFCAECNGKAVGFSSYALMNNFWQEGYIAYIHELIVDAGFRGQGVGSQLLAAVVADARMKGCKKVELDSAFHRGNAHKFYENRGFVRRAYLFSQDL